MDHSQFEKRLEIAERDIIELQKAQKTQCTQSAVLETMLVNIKDSLKELKDDTEKALVEVKQALTELKEKPARRWDLVVTVLITAIITSTISATVGVFVGKVML